MDSKAQNQNMEMLYMKQNTRDTEFSFGDDEEFRLSIWKLTRSMGEIEAKPHRRKYFTKHMKQFPELYRSDVSIHPSYTRLRDLPYHVVCRRRLQKIRKQIANQLNREIMHFAMMQMFAIDCVRVDRVFSIGMSPKTLIVPDFATEQERRRINELLRDP